MSLLNCDGLCVLLAKEEWISVDQERNICGDIMLFYHWTRVTTFYHFGAVKSLLQRMVKYSLTSAFTETFSLETILYKLVAISRLIYPSNTTLFQLMHCLMSIR
jgi:hypothetical protein